MSILSSHKWTTREKRILFVGFLFGCGTYSIGALVYLFYLVTSSPLFADTYDDYSVSWAPYNYRHVSKDGEIIVHPAVIEYDVVGTYIIGLRLPIQIYDCGGRRRV